MKLFKGLTLISQTELSDALKDAEKRAYDKAKKQFEAEYAERFETAEKTIKARNKTIAGLREDIEEQDGTYNKAVEKLTATIEVYEADRDEARDVIKQKMANDDKEVVIQQFKEQLDERQAKLKTREAKIGQEEEGEYKRGYADGVSDGVRKISEITQGDRDNAMKVAMVAAASHTPVENIKELNNVHQLTAGSDSKKS